MALSDFFKINLPYGLKKNEGGFWAAFNREHKPLGENDAMKHFEDSEYTHADYGRFSDKFFASLAIEPNAIERNEKGKIITVFFNNDGLFTKCTLCIEFRKCCKPWHSAVI